MYELAEALHTCIYVLLRGARQTTHFWLPGLYQQTKNKVIPDLIQTIKFSHLQKDITAPSPKRHLVFPVKTFEVEPA